MGGDPLVLLAVVYAVAGGDVPVGDGLGAGEAVPAGVRGLLLPGHGVVQLGPGVEARVGAEAGRLELGRGSVRLVADGELVVRAAGVDVRVVAGRALLRADGARDLVACAEGGSVTLVVPEPAEDGPGVADEGAIPLGADECRRLVGGRPSGPPSPLDAREATALRRGAEGASPAPPELPDVVGDPAAVVAVAETALADELERGARQEAAACGCSEDSAGGGTLDGGGGGPPTPDPEPPEPATLRIRVRLPPRAVRR